MMGERTLMQEALFYEFSLERHVPALSLKDLWNATHLPCREQDTAVFSPA